MAEVNKNGFIVLADKTFDNYRLVNVIIHMEEVINLECLHSLSEWALIIDSFLN